MAGKTGGIIGALAGVLLAGPFTAEGELHCRILPGDRNETLLTRTGFERGAVCIELRDPGGERPIIAEIWKIENTKNISFGSHSRTCFKTWGHVEVRIGAPGSPYAACYALTDQPPGDAELRREIARLLPLPESR